MQFRMLQYLPLFFAAITLLAITISYCLAIILVHVYPCFPYISDVGSLPPESCVFAQLMNFAALLLLGCVFIRHAQIQETSRSLDSTVKVTSYSSNIISTVIGITSAIGLSILANFQKTSSFAMHSVGTLTCYGGALAYFSFQIHFSKVLKHHKRKSMRCLYYSRLCLLLFSSFLLIVSMVCGVLSLQKFEGDDEMRWDRSDGGWELHVISAAAQWVVVIFCTAFIATFSLEFSDLTVRTTVIRLKEPQHQPQHRVSGSEDSSVTRIERISSPVSSSRQN